MTRLAMTLADLWPSAATRRQEPLHFNLRELSGSLGDLGTFIPLSVVMALNCGMDIGVIFIFAGLMNVVTGLVFRQPIPVQPMKAIAAVAIAEGLSGGAIASAGMVLGLIVFVLSIVGGVDWMARAIPKAVVRGIQAGVGLKLAWTGLKWLMALPAIGWDSWLVVAVVGSSLLMLIGSRQPTLLYLFAGGLVLAGLHSGGDWGLGVVWLPRLDWVMPTGEQWWTGVTRGAIAQLPLTLLNSVIAVCALSGDYFPGRGIAPRRMAASVGLMNLLCVPFGAMPMCHGAGGLAAQHRFGARTGGSVVMLGGLKIAAGLLLGGLLLSTLQNYPTSILGVMVIFAGLSLAWATRDCRRGRDLLIVAAMTGLTLAIDTLSGFVIGCAMAAAIHLIDRRTKAAAE